jgi:hypothetical protein
MYGDARIAFKFPVRMVSMQKNRLTPELPGDDKKHNQKELS